MVASLSNSNPLGQRRHELITQECRCKSARFDSGRNCGRCRVDHYGLIQTVVVQISPNEYRRDVALCGAGKTAAHR